MTDQNVKVVEPVTAESPRQPSRMLITGSILWMLCLIALFVCWFQWRENVLARKAKNSDSEQLADQSTDGDGKPKAIRLVPTKDGGFEAKDASDEDLWDKEGIEDFSFTDTNGQTLTKKDLLGKPFIIAFVFTQCRGPCPKVTLQMRELQDLLKNYDFNLVSLTVDPERDTPEILEKYGKLYGADFDRWKFVTGDQAQIYGLIQRSFKMPVEEAVGEKRKPGFEIIHSTNIMLVNSEGRVIGKFNATKDDEMARLKNQLEKIAARKNKKESAAEEGSK